ncbi:hypothetical protein M9434_003454 [Picochlorum sp. BPE23]|nr:hypothetical protein M9434_003454 [Picochlorum sp. BPE23]
MAALANVARNGLRWTSMSLKRTLLQTEQCMDESSLSMAFSRLFRMEISSSSAATSDVMRKESMFHKTRVEQRQLGQARYHADRWSHQADGDGPSSSPVGTQEATSSGMNPLQQVPVAQKDTGREQLAFSPSKAGEKRARAILRGARIGPRKLNTFVDVLRGLHIEDALIQCQVHHKKAARMCEKLLRSAKANAVTNHGLDPENLKVEQAWVGKGQYLRRISIHGRGRSGVMHKTRSHLTVILKEEATPRRTKIIPMLQERKKWRRDGTTTK